MSSPRERPLCFDCEGDTLVGVLAVPDQPPRVGVVVVVGGPQYRVGSHRQFTLLARTLAAAGIACLRFDLRGMGDSDGPRRGFEHADADLRAAVDALHREVRSLQRTVLWGLCDGAAACAFYAAQDARVSGLALFNPWVRTDAGAAEATLRTYYGSRILDPGFWRKLATGGVDLRAALRDAVATVRRMLAPSSPPQPAADLPLPVRVGEGLCAFRGPMLVALSERDTVAGEFRLAMSREAALRNALSRPTIVCREMPGADHTFSSARWRTEAEQATLQWLRAQDGAGPAAAAATSPAPG